MIDYLITGCSGYIGSKVIDFLKLNNYSYLGIDKQCTDTEDRLKFNLVDKDKTLQILKERKPKIIVHCGTFSAIPYREDFLSSFREDAIALSNILEYLKQNQEVRFVFFSSSYVYSGISSDEICNEDKPLNPSHNFGIAKLFFENLILRCHFNSLIFRLSSVFGSGNQLQPNAIRNMIEQAIENKVVDVWGKGTRKMQYIYINDVVQTIIDSNKFNPGVYNLGGINYISVLETANIISKKTFSKVNFLVEKTEGYTLPLMSIDKLRNENFGKVPQEITSSLGDYINQFKI